MPEDNVAPSESKKWCMEFCNLMLNSLIYSIILLPHFEARSEFCANICSIFGVAASCLLKKVLLRTLYKHK